jgi:hypothetical protein
VKQSENPRFSPPRLFWFAGVLLMMAGDQVLYVGLMQHRAPLRYGITVLHPQTSATFHAVLVIILVIAQVILLWRASRSGRWQLALGGGAVSLVIALMYVFVLM